MARARPLHPATVAQQRSAPGTPSRPPHPAKAGTASGARDGERTEGSGSAVQPFKERALAWAPYVAGAAIVGLGVWGLSKLLSGPGVVRLVGVTHSLTSNFELIRAQCAQGTTVVLEYPPLGDGTYFSSKVIATIADTTQADAARYAESNQLRLIGADGRKALDGDKVVAISPRHKSHERVVYPAQLIAKQTIVNLAKGYTEASLGLSQGSADDLVQHVPQLIEYLDGTDVGYVLEKTFARVQSLASSIEEDARRAISQGVLAQLAKDLTAAYGEYDEEKAEYELHGALKDLIQRTNDEVVAALFDAACNLLLYTEVVANRRSNLVVVFGDKHLQILREVLQAVGVTAEYRRL